MDTDRQTLPICVDLDGTLVYTDTLLEAYMKLIKHRPLSLLQSIWWLRGGRAYLKHQISQRVSLHTELLPYNKPLLDWLQQQQRRGHKLCLATGSDVRLARQIANHLGIFQSIVASDGVHNRSGQGKAQGLIEKFGRGKFIYVGNSRADLPAWSAAHAAIVVNASPLLTRKVKRVATVRQVLSGTNKLSVQVLWRAWRIHHWTKNLLLLVPLIAAHQLINTMLLSQVALGFLAFSLTASSIYLLNDMMDLETDRQHHSKKYRPLASGQLSIRAALVSTSLLLAAGLVLALLLPPMFLAVLAAYVAINLAYSWYVKRIVVLDVLLLASLYVLRILAGSAAAGITTSIWLFIFAALIFASLALVKRTAELVGLTSENQIIGRSYTRDHLKTLVIVGGASGLLSLVVLGLYITSNGVGQLYQKPTLLWWLIPIFFIWLVRVWRLTVKGQVHEDPIVFAARDTPSYITGVAALLVIFLAT
jgi:4-hydroxybenzoate polyprenyltransferase/phosphoserine phosphatase